MLYILVCIHFRYDFFSPPGIEAVILVLIILVLILEFQTEL